MKELRPTVVQVSGCEPLMRRDVLQVVRNIQMGSGMPYTIFVSNWYSMTKEKYLALREAGINQFSPNRLINEFTRTNTCDECYMSIRSNLDKTYSQRLWENVVGFFSFKPRVKRVPDREVAPA